ncbi:MAG: branched-chain amino acid ABC transporter permease [Chloroflexi bacterium]|nr:branched-chain amino acid ABC transporter permease [Chloroflexota bacterium]
MKISWKYILVIALIVMGFLIPNIGLNLYQVGIFWKVWWYILATASIRLLITTGQLTLAHGAFMAIGGYTSLILTVEHNWAIVPAVIAGRILSACLRVKGGYFVFFSLAFTHLVEEIAIALPITHGNGGIQYHPAKGSIFFGSEGRVNQYYIVMIVAVICLLIMWRLERSRQGMSWWAIRLRDNLAQSVGIQLARYKVINFIIGSIMASILGSLWGYYMNSLYPMSFSTLISVHLSVYAIVGGITSLWGAILGAGIFTAVPEFLRVAGEWQPIITGSAMIICMIFLPRGLISLPEKYKKWRTKLKKAAAGKEVNTVGNP